MRRVILFLGYLLASLLVLQGCTTPKDPVRIAINPWPGYEFLYLAEHKGFFKEVGLNAELVQLGSLSDAQRSYINGYVDGLASTVVEAVQAQVLSDNPLKIVLLPDFSNGGDVIVGHTEFKSVQDLKGKTVGAEVSSLGLYFIQQALSQYEMTLDDINLVNVEQIQGIEALNEGDIAAFMTYPPVSIEVLQNEEFHIIFSSADIPGEIIDTVAISQQSLDENPGFKEKLHKVWDMAIDYYRNNPEEALQIMATNEGISTSDFQSALDFIILLSSREQEDLLKPDGQLTTITQQVCRSLVSADSLKTDCSQLPNLLSPGS